MLGIWCWDRGAEAVAGAGPRKGKVVRAVVEDGGVMAAVSEESNQDTPRNGQEDVMDMMIPVNEHGSRDETRSKEGKHDRKPFPKASMVIRESLELRVQVESQKRPDEERLGSVATGERLHCRQQIGV